MAVSTNIPGLHRIRYIVAANAAIFLAIWICRLFDADIEDWFALPASLSAMAVRPWTILTYMVTQVEFFHLFFNMLWLWCLSAIYERISPKPEIGTIYLTGGIGGAIGYIVFNLFDGGYGSLCGASAAVLGMMTYAAAIAGNTRIQLFLLGTLRVRTIVIIAVAIALLGAGKSIGALAAHSGGLAAGILWALKSKLPNGYKTAPRRKGDKIAVALRNRREQQAELDALLDKIRISGFESLTDKERKKLETLSNRLDIQ